MLGLVFLGGCILTLSPHELERMFNDMNRLFLSVAAWCGATAVALGAFGAHGLARALSSVEDGNVRLEWWKTAALYHIVHALALAVAAAHAGEGRWAATSRHCFVWGIVLFSGSLYAMALTGQRWLGAVTPFGGLSLLIGWICLAHVVRQPAR
jgi:uncharacterized membrane protein YgdD (TMEM256/DUF423 family)